MLKYIIFGAVFTVSSFAFAERAVHIENYGCGLLDGSGGYAFTTDSRTTVTNSPNGNTILKCKAKNVSNNTGHAVRWNNANTGLRCNTQRGSTTDWHETVSTNGRAVLTCKYSQ